MTSGVDSLRVLVVELHDVHGVGGSALACVECVVAALNQAEFDLQNKIKDKLNGS